MMKYFLASMTLALLMAFAMPCSADIGAGIGVAIEGEIIDDGVSGDVYFPHDWSGGSYSPLPENKTNVPAPTIYPPQTTPSVAKPPSHHNVNIENGTPIIIPDIYTSPKDVPSHDDWHMLLLILVVIGVVSFLFWKFILNKKTKP